MTLSLKQKTSIIDLYCNAHSECKDCLLDRTDRDCCDDDFIEEDFKVLQNAGLLKGIAIEEVNETVNSPSYYSDGKIEPIEYIEDKKLGFCLGDAIKYISRAGKKDPTKEVEDLRKAIWYIERHIKTLEEVKND